VRGPDEGVVAPWKSDTAAEPDTIRGALAGIVKAGMTHYARIGRISKR